MENNQTKTVAIDFSKDKKRALRILANEKKAREAIYTTPEKPNNILKILISNTIK